jgi:hypothetical protein
LAAKVEKRRQPRSTVLAHDPSSTYFGRQITISLSNHRHLSI